jgi:hypothetical protein
VLDVGLAVHVHDDGFVVGQVSTNEHRPGEWALWTWYVVVCGSGAEVMDTLETWRLGRCGDVGSGHIPKRTHSYRRLLIC